MEINLCKIDHEKGKLSGSKKHSSIKDIKKKLQCINKRIGDLHHQRKFAYKNSVKVKKMVHNQINQIVKCFRARERSLCSDVDESYLSQNANINEELSKLQSVYAHCQALFNHIEDFKEKFDVLQNIDMILSEISIGGPAYVKPLEFLSDFEMMKVKANQYGCLEGDFVKKDEFIYVDEERDIKLADDKCEMSKDKEFLKLNNSASKVDSIITGQKSSLCMTTEKDDFQIIDLLDNMNCQDAEDFVMDEDLNVNNVLATDSKLNGDSNNTFKIPFRIKEHSTSKSSSDSLNTGIEFNPEEEWKEILEMNKKIASWHEMTSSGTINKPKEKNSTCDKIYNPHKFFQLKEANYWLHSSKNEELGKDKTYEKITNDMNSESPAEVIQKSFKSYFVKDNIQNWLSTY